MRARGSAAYRQGQAGARPAAVRIVTLLDAGLRAIDRRDLEGLQSALSVLYRLTDLDPDDARRHHHVLLYRWAGDCSRAGDWHRAHEALAPLHDAWREVARRPVASAPPSGDEPV